jgi:hypothetical protein
VSLYAYRVRKSDGASRRNIAPMSNGCLPSGLASGPPEKDVDRVQGRDAHMETACIACLGVGSRCVCHREDDRLDMNGCKWNAGTFWAQALALNLQLIDATDFIS